MAKKVNRLTAAFVRNVKDPGYHPDGHGLYLQVKKTKLSAAITKSWLYRYERAGVEHWHGLGSYPDVGVAEARILATECRKLRRQGIDPIEHKRAAKAQAQLEKARGITFEECALAYINAHRAGWRNDKHTAQWFNTLKSHAFPVFGNRSVQDIDVEAVLQALQPIWYTKSETATRVRQRIEAVLDWAAARDFRDAQNPARWRGHLDKLLPKRSRVQKVVHFEALAHSQLPALYSDIRSRKTLSSKALAFLILTAARSGEVRQAMWAEFDLAARVWTVPADRMKAGRPHRVPLVPEALAILNEVAPLRRDDDFVFPGHRKDRPLSDAAMRKLLQQDMGHQALTVHGFRSTFRDWCAESTNFPRELAEAALAHVLTDKTEAAYQRGDMFERRRTLMEAWAEFCLATSDPTATVVPFARRA